MDLTRMNLGEVDRLYRDGQISRAQAAEYCRTWNQGPHMTQAYIRDGIIRNGYKLDHLPAETIRECGVRVTPNQPRDQQPIDPTRVLALVEADDDRGLCTNCGAEASNVEPDAHNYACEQCGSLSVEGAESLLNRLDI